MDFEGYVLREMRKRYPNMEIAINDMIRTNRTYRGLTIKRDDNKVAPAINLTRVEQEMVDGGHAKEWAIGLIDEVYRHYLENIPELPEITKEYILDNVFYRLVNTEKNREAISKTIPTDFYDLSLVPYVSLTATGYFMATKALIDSFGISPEEIKAAAKTHMHPKVMNIADKIKECMFIEGLDEDDITGPSVPMYVISNESGDFGAACFLYGNCMDKLAEELDDDLYVFPSSVHEVIVVPARGTTISDASRIVSDVNGEVVDESIRLSDRAYFYNKDLSRFM